MSKWRIPIKRHRGFTPKYYENTYPSFGNKDQAGDMRNISLFDPSVMAPGPGKAALTNGTQAGAVTTLIKGILRTAVTADLTYAIGGARLFSLSSTTVTNAGGVFPHTIDKAAVTAEDGEDVLYYQGKLLYSYNHSGSAGDMGMYDLSSTFDDDYWTATLSGAALQSAPHQMINGGDDVVYMTNGRFIATLDGTTESDQGLDFWQNSVVTSITWNYNRVLAAVNRPNLAGVNVNQSAVYRWDGSSASWEGDPIEINGRIGALYTKNGVTYIWYEDFESGTARPTFGMISGGMTVPIRTFSGTLPLYYQVGEMNGYIVWMNGQRMMAYGPISGEQPADMFQLMSASYATAGGLSAPFGKILIASNADTNYNLAGESGYETDSYYYTLLFDVSEERRESVVDEININFDKLATGARVDLTLKDNKGTPLWTDSISYTADGAITKKRFYPRVEGENIRLEYSFSNGSTSNPVKIRGGLIRGHDIN